MQHRGEIVRKAIDDRGLNKSHIARLLKKSRKTLYNYLEKPNLDIDVIIRIGEIIHYDFFQDIKELRRNFQIVEEVREPIYADQTMEYWRDKYVKLLEEHTLLLKTINPNTQENK